jgi:hypothetical protein
MTSRYASRMLARRRIAGDAVRRGLPSRCKRSMTPSERDDDEDDDEDDEDARARATEARRNARRRRDDCAARTRA